MSDDAVFESVLASLLAVHEKHVKRLNKEFDASAKETEPIDSNESKESVTIMQTRKMKKKEEQMKQMEADKKHRNKGNDKAAAKKTAKRKQRMMNESTKVNL